MRRPPQGTSRIFQDPNYFRDLNRAREKEKKELSPAKQKIEMQQKLQDMKLKLARAKCQARGSNHKSNNAYTQGQLKADIKFLEEFLERI